MTVEQIIEIIDTRRKAAATEGNPTEISFLYELAKMANDYKKLKEQTEHKR